MGIVLGGGLLIIIIAVIVAVVASVVSAVAADQDIEDWFKMNQSSFFTPIFFLGTVQP